MASFKKLGTDNWQVSFYCKDYLGNNKKYKKSGFKTKALANEYAIEFIAKNTGSSEVLFHTILNEYYEFSKNKIKKQTLQSRKNTIKKIKEISPNISINLLDQKFFFNLFSNLEDKPALRRLSKSYISLCLDFCKINYNLKSNPCREYKLPRLLDNENDEVINKIWTLEEFREFEKLIDNMNENVILKYKTLFNLLYFTGARIGEILALTKTDIDLKNKTININKTKINSTETNSPKTKSSKRIIEINDYCVSLLSDYLKTIPDIVETQLFNSYETIKTQFRILLKKSDLPKISIHGFRHSHASLLINLGINIVDISKRLGHSNPGMTLKIYSHFYKNNNGKIIEALNKL